MQKIHDSINIQAKYSLLNYACMYITPYPAILQYCRYRQFYCAVRYRRQMSTRRSNVKCVPIDQTRNVVVKVTKTKVRQEVSVNLNNNH